MHRFQADLLEQGLADHPSIAAMGIMLEDPTVQQVMAMTPFMQALERKNAERRASVHSKIAQRLESLHS